MVPEDFRYTSEHEWVAGREAEPTYRVGVTDFAQQSLGDVVFIQLPDAGTPVTAGQVLGEVESTKSVSEVYSPVSGEVVAVNDALADRPELVNSDPYGEGWLVEIQAPPGGDIPELLDAPAYRELIAPA
ncbi:MAG: glycine cleavage system protein GcvH [Dactylosporangium sp.]|nr:glycine cleavage system protein GcvH [Dactylosporangium sp.]